MTLEDIASILELPPPTFLGAPSFEHAKAGLEDFKAIAKRQRRRLAARYHRNGQFADIMKEINAAADLAEKLQLIQRPQPVVLRFNFSTDFSTTTTFYSNAGGFSW